MQDLPLVSICIPTYNGAMYLKETLESAVHQSYPNTEILVADDGSSDGTVEMVQQWMEKHAHIRLIKKGSGQGMVANWNRCIAEAKGEWIKFIFQDDIMERNCIAYMLDECMRQNASVACCSRKFLIEPGVSDLTRHLYENLAIRLENVVPQTTLLQPEALAVFIKAYLQYNFLGEPSCYLFKRSLSAIGDGFNPALKQLVDYEFIMRLGLQEGLLSIPQTLVAFRVHENSESSKNISEQKDNDAQAQKHIRAVYGDTIVLFSEYMHNPIFVPVKDAVGEKVLDNYIRHIYCKGCKQFGRRKVNRAIRDVLTKYNLRLSYNLLLNLIYRKKTKWWLKAHRFFPYQNYQPGKKG